MLLEEWCALADEVRERGLSRPLLTVVRPRAGAPYVAPNFDPGLAATMAEVEGFLLLPSLPRPLPEKALEASSPFLFLFLLF